MTSWWWGQTLTRWLVSARTQIRRVKLLEGLAVPEIRSTGRREHFGFRHAKSAILERSGHFSSFFLLLLSFSGFHNWFFREQGLPISHITVYLRHSIFYKSCQCLRFQTITSTKFVKAQRSYRRIYFQNNPMGYSWDPWVLKVSDCFYIWTT